jgi:hypothetical protein
MNNVIPDFIADRICKPTLSKYVVRGSTPVPFFGNFFGASTYTIGINPSLKEFYSNSGELLKMGEKRLEDFQSLGIDQSLEFPYPISNTHTDSIFAACINYFQKKPYQWFNAIEDAVNKVCGSSYFKDSACHLDLVQWATDPIWSVILKEDPTDAQYLLESDLPFLCQQFHWIKKYNPRIERFVLSGKTVIDSLTEIFSITYVGKTQAAGKKHQYSLYVGDFYGTPVYGTSMNISDSHTSSAHRGYLSYWLREWIEQA